MHLSEVAGTIVSQAGGWLLAQAAALPDTIVTKTVSPEATWFEKLSTYLSAAMTLAFLVLTVAVVPAAWNFRKSYQKVSDLLDRVYADINPIVHHASRIAENVDYVSTAIRADVQRASATLTDANTRLQEAIVRAEARARDFDALIAVMQDETEGAFVSTASTVRGVRTGMETLRDALQLTLRDVRDAALHAPTDLPAPAPRHPDLLEDETHGPWNEFEYERDDAARAREPRVRPRGGSAA